MSTLYIGVDMGGTNVRTGLVDPGGAILAQDKRESLPRVSAEAPVTQIVDSINATIAAGGVSPGDITALGIGTPGPLNSTTGVIYKAGNLPHWIDFPLTDILRERTGIPSYLQNDANLFAYGEWWKGAGRGFGNFFAMTLGTGIGGGAICDGRLLTGFNDNAGEVGHTTIDHNGHQCWCGQRGCIELYASATGLVRITREALVNEHVRSSLEIYRGNADGLTARIIFEAALGGDEFAMKRLDTAGYLLGISIVNTLNILNFERVAVGGGLAGAGDLILGPARRALRDRGFSSFNGQVSIVPAELKGTAGILGAARLAMDREAGHPA